MDTTVDTSNLVALAVNKSTTYNYDKPDASLLESFECPMPKSLDTGRGSHLSEIHIEVPEFTSLCVVGDTCVDIATDESMFPVGVPIKDLVGTEGTVFSFDTASKKPVARKYTDVRKTRAQVECVTVSFFLYKGPSGDRRKEHKSITCTPDHKFLVRRGWGNYVWVRADALMPDDQLVADQRHGDTIRGIARHRLVVESSLGRLLEEGEVVHHIDGHHQNNTPENLTVLSSNGEHAYPHRTEEYGYTYTINIDDLVQSYSNGVGIPELCQMFSCDSSTIVSRLKKAGVPIRSQKDALLLKNRTPAMVALMSEARDFYESGYTTYELAEFYGVHPTTVLQWVQKAGGSLRTSLETKDLRARLEELPPLNHKVVSVSPAGKHDVYCMSVEETECFFAEGVVVHNCPLTGQPDFATIVIDYVPRDRCVESKSLKLYLMSFRNHGEFHESCVARIFSDLTELLDPKKLVVEGRFTPRGGIPFWPKISFDNWD